MRNRYLDLLRAAAIVRVIVYHLFGWPWLSIVLPAMGIMFALAGSLTAASLDKRAARKVVTSRLRRLLPPLWLLGVIAVPAMLAAGWAQEDGEHPFSVPRLLYWLVPLGDPQGSDKGIDAWEPLWYIRAYVWFILLSPLLYAVYRKVGWLAVAAPILLLAVLDKTGFALPDVADAAMWDFVTYGACWIAGFAHHDGRLARVRPGIVLAAAVMLGGGALYWLQGHQGEDAWDLNDVSESQALWSLAFVLLALRWQPRMSWLAGIRPLDKAVTLLNARAVTVYLWHNIAIAAVWPALTFVALDDVGHHLDGVVDLTASMLVTLLAVLLFGWAEDLAARRRPRLWPTGDRVPPPGAMPADERTPAPADAYPGGAQGPADAYPGGAQGPADELPGDGYPGPIGRQRAAATDRQPPDRPQSVPWVANVPAARPTVDGTAEVPAPGPRDPRTAPVRGSATVPGQMPSGPGAGGRARRTQTNGGGRHAAGEPEFGGIPDLGLPVAGRRVAPFTGHPVAPGVARRAGQHVAEAAAEEPDGPPAWPRTRPEQAGPGEQGASDRMRQRWPGVAPEPVD